MKQHTGTNKIGIDVHFAESSGVLQPLLHHVSTTRVAFRVAYEPGLGERVIVYLDCPGLNTAIPILAAVNSARRNANWQYDVEVEILEVPDESMSAFLQVIEVSKAGINLVA